MIFYDTYISHHFDIDHVDIFVNFHLSMRTVDKQLPDGPEIPVIPDDSVWLVEFDSVAQVVDSTDWLDSTTLHIVIDSISSSPDVVTVEFVGPDPSLLTFWGKQFPPFGPLTSSGDIVEPIRSGMIVLWSGSVATIPDGWVLCDGSNGTPDLRSKFVYGAGTVNPNTTGGAASHFHAINDDTHNHGIVSGYAGIGSGTTFQPTTTNDTHNHSESSESNIPPYYALCYIMFL